MGQDLRDLFKDEKNKKYVLRKGHETRFSERLEDAFPPRKRSAFFYIRIAASIAVLLSVGFFVYQDYHISEPMKTTVLQKDNGAKEAGEISLGDLSPDLKRVEHYYVNTINMELSQLNVSADNKVIVDDFMERLNELNTEYRVLIKELNETGPNEQTITALIKNLQLRLQLLQKLKEKLNQLKSSINETAITNHV